MVDDSAVVSGGSAEFCRAVMGHTGDGHRGRLHYAPSLYVLCAVNGVFSAVKDAAFTDRELTHTRL